MPKRSAIPGDDPLWYKDGIIYQLHVKAFFDSTGDGIGDFPGLTQKLDYLQDLGVTSLWLLPFYPSPLRDDGYDTAAYNDVHPFYGTLRDFRQFLKEAHRRGLRVITELVINHTSDQHPWFERSRRARPGSAWRDFYVWSDSPKKFKDARIIFKDFEPSNWTWDPVAHAYYWHRFYHHQPDLNFDNPAVHKAVFQALDFWMEMGVDGLRLDAIPYLYEREGTSCENLPETHAFLKKLRAHVDGKFSNRMLLAEANQWPEDARLYFGDGNECQMAFHFPLMPRLFMSVAMEERFPIIDIMQQTPEIPANCQWAVFLRNHDELTLEMVTDEDRDYMYRTYARDRQARINLGIRRRLAPLLGNHRRRIELMNALLFSFPGTPIVYYGDEIGMGDNIYLGDRDGVRTPMQWSPDRNAGFSRVNPQRLYLPAIIDPEYHFESVNVESQQKNPHSLLWWMKRVIDLRKRFTAFGRGSLEFLQPENTKVLAFIRRHENQVLLVVANLSRFVQGAELDLSQFDRRVPVELFGHSKFPVITERPYFVSLAPHSFYWFSLEETNVEHDGTLLRLAADVVVRGENLPALLNTRGRELLEGQLASYVVTRRWFGGKARSVKSISIADLVPLPRTTASIALIEIHYVGDETDVYMLPIAIAWGKESERIRKDAAESVIVTIESKRSRGVIYESTADRAFAISLLGALSSRKQMRGLEGGEIEAVRGAILPRGSKAAGLEPAFIRGEQSNSSIIFGDQWLVKMFRRLEPGLNPDVEITRFLTERCEFPHVPRWAGTFEYRRDGGEPITLALVQQFIPNGGDAWRYTIDALGRFFDVIASKPLPQEWLEPRGHLVQLASEPIPEFVTVMLETYVAQAELLGQRTGEMHVALSCSADDPDFAPEPFTPFYVRSVYQSMRSQATRSLQLVRRKLRDLSGSSREAAEKVLAAEPQIQRRLQALLGQRIEAKRLRIHGDYHLGQVLFTGKDFVIIDFEGEPSRPISERRIKRSPLRDVAGMLRSFHYAPYAILFGQAPGVSVRIDDIATLEPAARFWQHWVSVIFLRSYLAAARAGGFLPSTDKELSILLDAFMFEKALFEIAYELNHRPDWVVIPFHGISQLLQESP